MDPDYHGDGEFGHILSIAQGSAGELDHHLLLARDLHLLEDATYHAAFLLSES